jgi:multidrug efflux pump subunit AcrB
MGIYIIIAAIFRSYVQPLVIMATVPFGMVGAVLGQPHAGVRRHHDVLFGIVPFPASW